MMNLSGFVKVTLLAACCFVALISTWDGLFSASDARFAGAELFGTFMLCALIAVAVAVPPTLVPRVVRSSSQRVHAAGIIGVLIIVAGIVAYHWSNWPQDPGDHEVWIVHPPLWQRGGAFILYIFAIGTALTFLGLWDERRRSTRSVARSNPPPGRP